MEKFLKQYQNIYIYLYLLIASIFSSAYYITIGKNLLYADAMSRLDIARKIIDNLTPGLAQVGNVWLPLPQIFMVPFIWSHFLWQSGIAGSIMSGLAFIVGGTFIYKSAKLISRSFLSSLLALSIYALNINILYLQSTAMSESLFMCTLAACIYYFLRWFKTDNGLYLVPAGIAVSAMTLTRYEGLAILFSSIPLVFIYSWFKSKSFHHAEGDILLYGVLASAGFLLWTLYLTAIFGDPLYWIHYYATPQATGDATVKVYSQSKPFIAAIWQYLTSCIWMIGLIPIIFSILSIILMVINDIRKKSFYFLPLLMPLSIFLFMVFTLQRNTPIVQPSLSLRNLLSPNTSYQVGFNIRYGILLLPWVAVISAYIFKSKYAIVKILIFAIVFIQVFNYFSPSYSVIYQIPLGIQHKPYQDLVAWMKQNYDGGLILASAGSMEDQIFEIGLDYKNYIHEGTNKYWKESMDAPSKYASWVIMMDGKKDDPITLNLKGTQKLLRDFNLVYNKNGVKIYKIKTKPWIQLQ